VIVRGDTASNSLHLGNLVGPLLCVLLLLLPRYQCRRYQ